MVEKLGCEGWTFWTVLHHGSPRELATDILLDEGILTSEDSSK
jgi:hypothetical protein